MSTGQTGSSQVDLGHWFLRLLALIIDSIPLSIIAFVVWGVLSVLVWGGGFWWFGFGWGLSWFGWPFFFGVIELLYFTIMEVSYGATMGKKLLGFEVKTTDGAELTFDKSLIRNISKIHGLFLFLDWIVAVATPGSDPRQKYTDRIAGTTVVAVRQAFVSSAPSAPPPPPPP